MRELSTQAASDTVGAEERGFINNELQELLTEMQNIASRTEFNGANLLDGSFGVAASGTGTLDVGDALTNSIVTAVGVDGAAASTTFTISDEGGNTVRLTNGTSSETQDIDLDNNASYPLALGDEVTIDFDQMGISVTILASGAVTTTNTAADLDGLTVITTANSDAVVQVGAFDGAANRLSISFSDMRVQNGNATGAGELDALFDALDTYNTTSNQANAQALLTAIDNGLQLVSSERSVLGAKQNRIDYTIANLMTSAENTAAARGRIADTDFAAETSALTRNQILQQAGVSMLAQANALPQNVLALLQ
jgi:flagellin